MVKPFTSVSRISLCAEQQIHKCVTFPPVRPMPMPERTVDAANAAKPNQRNASVACASRHRPDWLPGLVPFVIELCRM